MCDVRTLAHMLCVHRLELSKWRTASYTSDCHLNVCASAPTTTMQHPADVDILLLKFIQYHIDSHAHTALASFVFHFTNNNDTKGINQYLAMSIVCRFERINWLVWAFQISWENILWAVNGSGYNLSYFVCVCSPMCLWIVIITLGLSLTKWEIEEERLGMGNNDAINLFSFTVILFIVLTKWHIIESSHTRHAYRDEAYIYVWQRFTHRPQCECCSAIHFHHEFIRNLNALPSYDLLFFRSFDTFRREVLA